jgi:cell division protein FtsL
VSVVAPAPVAPRRERAPKAEPKEQPRQRMRKGTLARRRQRSPVAPGVAWVLLLATLFGGIVALNVGALRNSIDASKLDAQGASLRTQNADLAARVATLSGYGRISKAATDLGMVQAQPGRHDFISLAPAAHKHAAAKPKARTQSAQRRPRGSKPAR